MLWQRRSRLSWIGEACFHGHQLTLYWLDWNSTLTHEFISDFHLYGQESLVNGCFQCVALHIHQLIPNLIFGDLEPKNYL